MALHRLVQCVTSQQPIRVIHGTNAAALLPTAREDLNPLTLIIKHMCRFVTDATATTRWTSPCSPSR